MGTVISDYCWVQSVVLIGPLVTILGIALTIPISMIFDNFYEHKHFNWEYYLGTLMIISSFITISVRDYLKSKGKNSKAN